MSVKIAGLMTMKIDSHHTYVTCRYDGHTSRKGLFDVFLRRRQSGRKWNWPDQGNHLETGHRVHEQNEHLGVADVAGRGLLHSRCHLFLLQQTPLATSQAKTPVTGRFPVNAVRQDPRKAPELVPDDSQYLLGQKQQQGRKFRYSNATRFAS